MNYVEIAAISVATGIFINIASELILKRLDTQLQRVARHLVAMAIALVAIALVFTLVQLRISDTSTADSQKTPNPSPALSASPNPPTTSTSPSTPQSTRPIAPQTSAAARPTQHSTPKSTKAKRVWPNVVGLSLDEADRVLNPQQLYIGSCPDCDVTEPKWTSHIITRQSPAAYTPVPSLPYPPYPPDLIVWVT